MFVIVAEAAVVGVVAALAVALVTGVLRLVVVCMWVSVMVAVPMVVWLGEVSPAKLALMRAWLWRGQWGVGR
jgi:hypothetical protein